MFHSQKKINKLPLIPLDEFELKVAELEIENWKVRALIKSLGSWEKFNPILLRDLFVTIGARPIINKY